MSAFEGSYKSLLLGVTQQVARERLPGQVQAQENMLSDPVTNLRRRPGLRAVYSLAFGDVAADSLVAWYTDIGGQMVHVWLDTNAGAVRVLDTEFNVLATITNSYFQAPSPQNIYGAAMQDEFFIANTDIIPQNAGATQPQNSNKGFLVVKTGNFSLQYAMSLAVSGAGTYNYSYTTPSGANAGDAAESTVTYIAQQLASQINADTGSHGVTAYRSGNTLFMRRPQTGGTVSVTTSTGSVYMVASGRQYIRDANELPPILVGSGSNGFVVGTGAQKDQVYYRYDASAQAWLEDGAPGSPSGIVDMPRSIRRNANGSFSLVASNYEGRLAGDDETNENPPFLDSGITGMGTYQGRLVLLAGSQVSMSASNNARRFYRSTVTTTLPSDPIHIGSSANSSAAYQHCLQFQKDLLLFSAKYQALVPSGNAAIAPNTAAVLITSTYDADMTAPPVTLGRTVMYPAPISESYFGFKEMLPSPYTDSQYISQDATSHLPKYMAGRCRIAVASTTANMVLFGPSNEPNALIVHEYAWSGEEKVQQAWHKWTFRYPVAAAYFVADRIIILFAQNQTALACELDPRAGSFTQGGGRRPFLDFWTEGEVEQHLLSLEPWRQAFDTDPDMPLSLRVAQLDGELMGEAVGAVWDADAQAMRTVRSFPDGAVSLGFPFRSAFSPTSPMVLDENGVKISSNKLTLLRYMISTNKSAEYQVLVQDANYPEGEEANGTAAQEAGTVYWDSRELELGRPREGGDSTAIVPTRTNADTTTMLVYTEGMGELNIVALEYVCRYNQRLRRR